MQKRMDGFRIMSTDFQTIEQCKLDKKGAFIGFIIKQGDLKSGTSNKGTSSEKDWTNKRFTISDANDEIELTAWNGDIEKFKVGNKYEFTGFWFKEYQGAVQLSVGKYGKVNLIGTATTEPKGVDFGKLNAKIEDDNPEPQPAVGQLAPPTNPLPEIGPNLEVFSEEQCIQLLQIEKVVKETMNKFEPNKIHEGQKVGMHVKEIYRESKKFKFEKASEQ